MKKFMGLLLVMALLVGTASIVFAEDCAGTACTDSEQELVVSFEVVQDLWLKVKSPGKLTFNPKDCALTNATKTFDWGYAANGCATFRLNVDLDCLSFTADSCGCCADSAYYPTFKLTINGVTKTMAQGDSKCFGVLTRKFNCDRTMEATPGTLELVATPVTCTGTGTAPFTFTIYAECL